MKLRATWNGDLPNCGDYLMSPIRPRFAYRIDSYEATLKQFGPTPDAQKSVWITVTRVKASDVPEGAVIHDWKWDSRDPKDKKQMVVR